MRGLLMGNFSNDVFSQDEAYASRVKFLRRIVRHVGKVVEDEEDVHHVTCNAEPTYNRLVLGR